MFIIWCEFWSDSGEMTFDVRMIGIRTRQSTTRQIFSQKHWMLTVSFCQWCSQTILVNICLNPLQCHVSVPQGPVSWSVIIFCRQKPKCLKKSVIHLLSPYLKFLLSMDWLRTKRMAKHYSLVGKTIWVIAWFFPFTLTEWNTTF